MQEAYCRAYEYWPSFDPEKGKIGPWFNKIMFNSLRDMQREYHNSPKESSDDPKLCPEQILNHMPSKGSLYREIEKVENERHNRVLTLFFILGYNSREISQIEEKMTQTNVTSIITRFRKDVL